MTPTDAPAPPQSPGGPVWLNGQLYADDQAAQISVFDHGLVVGDGIFDATKVTDAGAFAVRRHLDRMGRSAAAMGLPAPDPTLVRSAINAVLAERTFDFGVVRITYTGGLGPLGSGSAQGPTTLIVAARPVPRPAPTAVITTPPWTRNERGAMTGVKTTSYAENVRSLAYAAERGASEAVMVNTIGNLCEGTGSNLFCVFGDQVVTPPLAAGPLAGITRELVLEWSPVVERDLTLAEAQASDEVFLTSSLRDVQPVTRWDGHEFPADGPRTAEIAGTFRARSQADIDP